MSAAIVQINFSFNVPVSEQVQASMDKADMFNQVDGLLWKIWLLDEAERISGGIYLFEDRERARAYADGEIVAELCRQRPDISVRVFDIMEQPSRITRAPLP